MKIDMNMKWNDYSSDTLYLWDGKTLFKIAEGTGDNLFDEDIEDGYVDYWMTDYYDFEDSDGGQWLETEYIKDIDYTIQGVIDRIKACDLWDSNWEILDEDIGEEMAERFEEYYGHISQTRYHQRRAEELKDEIKKMERRVRKNG